MKRIVVLLVALLLVTIPHTFNSPNFRKHTVTKNDLRQINCLMDNIYHEARGESEIGKYAVAFVTMNRVNSGYYPNDVCEVVKQRKGNTCQFTWVCKLKSLTRIDQQEYNTLVPIAYSVYFNHMHMIDPTMGALFYHANYVNPRWNRRMIRTGTIGNHIFYKLKEHSI